ncbi:MAG: hypothetical protein DWQ34_11255 [Planctomycetota bacterium]|nr:MAG: hypothetical protein DWQ29_04395 [Planctomycetota bacterium]REJ93049.1 MAG: hypothetical protein DWQ34_11255 [Planctomycetota bacterium]REK30036.1 MAG: hypothetical protein DWQ41_02560 [Planctomycetota bacterium]REK37722.1 MAG: hypothetical protein DWQ45_06965 [Planctomycetota bacterium]
MGWAALLFVLTSSQSALATCGDYLQHAGLSPAADSTVALTGDNKPVTTPAPVAPCHGPHCRNSSSPPGAPAAPLEWRSTAEQALVSLNGASDDSTAHGRLPESDRTARDGYPRAIERPPRAG